MIMDEYATKRVFLECMEKEDCQSWLKGKAVIDSFLKSQPFLSESFKSSVKDAFKRVKNVLMLVYLHSLDIKPPSSYFSYNDEYEEKYKEICKDKQATYFEVFLWISGKKGEELQNITQFFIEYFPNFMHKKLTHVSLWDLEFLIRVFNMMEVKTNRSALLTMDFLTTLQNMTVGQMSRYDCKENVIIMAVLETASGEAVGKGNLCLLIDEYLIGRLQEQKIEQFCFVHSTYLSELHTNQLLKVAHELFQKGANAYLIELIIRITNILAQGEEFFKLKQMYIHFVLPIIARRAKACTRQGVEKAALSLCELYAVGFNEHCDIGQNGAECLLANVQQVTSEKYKKRWIELAFFTAKQVSVFQLIEETLKRKGMDNRIISQCKHPFFDKQPWNITTRSIKQHKNYTREPSKYKGINNRQFQCYIISVVQALFMTKQLPALLAKTSKDQRCINTLNDIFGDLQRQSRWTINVNRLQEDGPQEFAKSQDQQDAQQYLLALMNIFEEYFRSARLEKQFKDIFQVCSQTVITCKHCKHETTSKQSQYIHTISNKEKLALQWQQTIFDFVCAHCQKKQSTKRTTLVLHCRVLIVHINRFSNVGGLIKKELPSERILRRFADYELVGMIFHIGKFVHSGHYIYYSKVGKKRWVEFNDQNTSEFQLDNEDEEFQKEFKAEKTPYILFYQKVA